MKSEREQEANKHQRTHRYTELMEFRKRSVRRPKAKKACPMPFRGAVVSLRFILGQQNRYSYLDHCRVLIITFLMSMHWTHQMQHVISCLLRWPGCLYSASVMWIFDILRRLRRRSKETKLYVNYQEQESSACV